MNNAELWQAVLAELELGISKANFITWFKNTGIVSFDGGHAMLCVPNAFTQSWLEKKYHQLIIKSIERITGKPIKKLEYKIDQIKNIPAQPLFNSNTSSALLPSTLAPTPAPLRPTDNNGGFTLNPKYTFDSFVVGKTSELAYAAAQAVASRPGTAYNPLFIYGSVGLGKTHLLQAIGTHLSQTHQKYSVLYVSAEKFSNDFITSVREKNAKEFQNRYRTIDLLLIDDIQFIAGKEGTQESFFHTFNELHQQNKQVVITSDRPPKAIPALEERLKSRFEWGMIVDISPPDFETRTAILEKKCIEKNFPLPDKVLQTMATLVQSNIRELEGALNKIIAFHQLKNLVPTVESVKTILSVTPSTGSRQLLTPNQLTNVVSQFYNISLEDLVGKNREKKVAVPRQMIMYLMREELKMSYPAIGDELGGRDHTTAIHAHEKIKHGIEADMRLKQELELLRQRLYVNNV